MKFCLLFVLLVYPANGNALEAGPYRVVGKVRSFDSERVVLDTGVSLIEVPRKLIFEKNLKAEQIIRLTLLTEDRKLLAVRKRVI